MNGLEVAGYIDIIISWVSHDVVGAPGQQRSGLSGSELFRSATVPCRTGQDRTGQDRPHATAKYQIEGRCHCSSYPTLLWAWDRANLLLRREDGLVGLVIR